MPAVVVGRLAAWTCTLGISVGLIPAASAQPLDLRWEGPGGCPSAQEVGARAETLLRTAAPLAEPVRVDARASARADGRFELVLEGRAGRRTLIGESCEVLADAAALIAAMMVDPEAVGRAQAGDPGAGPEDGPTAAKSLERLPAEALGPPPPGARPPARAVAAHDPGAPSAPVAGAGPARLHLRAGGLLDLGSLPGAAVGPSLAVGLTVGRLRLEARAHYLPPSTAAVRNHPRAAGDVGLAAGAVGACGALWRGALEAGPCGAVELGAMHAEGRGVTTPSSATALWAAVAAGGYLALPLGDWLALRVGADALLPLTRPAFVIDGVPGTVHRPAPLAARVGFGAEVRFR